MAVRILTGMLLEGLEWLGHAGFRIGVGRASIYIDPYRVSDSEPKADLVLITHQHYDHFSIQDLERLRKDDTRVIAPAAEAARRIQPTVAVPMHWGGHIGSEEDAKAFADAAPVDVVIMQPAVAA